MRILTSYPNDSRARNCYHRKLQCERIQERSRVCREPRIASDNECQHSKAPVPACAQFASQTHGCATFSAAYVQDSQARSFPTTRGLSISIMNSEAIRFAPSLLRVN